MRASASLGPFPTPYRTNQLWVCVGFLVLVVICAPMIQALLGLPPFAPRVQISSGVITLLAMVPAVWPAFRLGHIPWFLLGVLMLAFGLWAQFHA
jgi:hypothetical protein